MKNFGDLIRKWRKDKEMLLRHLSAELDINIARLIKIDRGAKTAKRDI